MNTASTSDADSGISTLYEDGINPAQQRRTSRRLQGQPPEPLARPVLNAPSAVPHQQPGLVSPPGLPPPAHHHNQAQPPQDHHAMHQEHNADQPVGAPQVNRFRHQPAPLPPPVQEVHMQLQPPPQLIANYPIQPPTARPPRQLQFQPAPSHNQSSASTSTSHTSSHQFSQASPYHGPNFNPMDTFDDNSIPSHMGEAASLPVPLRGGGDPYQRMNSEVVNLRGQLANMQHTVATLQQNVGGIVDSCRRTDERLASITETNLAVQRALQQNTSDFRSFIRSDFTEIIRAQIDNHAPRSRRSDRTSSTASTVDHAGSEDTSVYAPPRPNVVPARSPGLAPLHPAPTAAPAPPAHPVPAPVAAPAPPTAPTAPPVQPTAPMVAPTQPTAPSTAPVPPTAPPAIPIQTIPASADPTMTIILKMLENKEKLSFHTLKKATKSAFLPWKEEAMVAMELHPAFSTYIETSPSGTKSIKSSIPQSLRTKLYVALSKALDHSVKAEIGWDGTQSDGMIIIAKLDKKFGHKQNSELNRLNLVSTLNSIKKSKDEKLHTYHRRFKLALEECRINDVMPLKPAALTLLYMRNLQEPCLMDIVLKMGQGTAQEWNSIVTLDALKDRVEEYLDEYTLLQASLPGAKKPRNHSTEMSSNHNNSRITSNRTSDEKDEYSTRLKRVCGGLRDKTKDQRVKHLVHMMNQRKKGCFIHGHDEHALARCKKLHQLCEDFKCSDALHIATSQFKASNSSSPPSDSTKPQLKRVQADLDKQTKALERATEKMEEREAYFKAKMEENQNLLKAMHLTLAQQGGSSTDTTTQNRFESLLMEDDTDDDEVEDPNDGGDDRMDEDVGTNSNSNVNSYSCTSPFSTTPSSHQIIGQCNHITTTTSHTTTVVDSGATVHMDRDASIFEYIEPATTSDGLPLYVQQGDGSDLLVTGVGPVTKRINDKITVRYLSYLVPSLGSSLYSVKQHMKYAGCYFHAQSNKALLAFPSTILSLDTSPEIQFNYQSPVPSTPPPSFNFDTAPLSTDLGQFKAKLVKTKYFDPSFPLPLQEKMALTVPFHLRSPDAIMPARATPGSIGYDTHSTASLTILPGSTIKAPTGLACAIPKGIYAKLHTRSSHALAGLTVQGGVIDNDYRGEIQVILHNSSDEAILINKGDKIAQMVFECAETPFVISSTTLPATSRGDQGFGSTNKRPPRKRGMVQFSDQMYFVDKSNSGRIKTKRVSHPPSLGLRVPKPVNHYLKNKYWQDHSLDPDPDSPTEPALLQKHPPQQTVNATAPATAPVPRIRPQERVNNADPAQKTLSQDDLLQSIGFLKPTKLLRNLDTLGTGSVKVSHLDRNPKLSPGETASIKATRSSKIPVQIRNSYSDLWHMDIGYGPCASIGGVKHTLLFVDNSSRYKFVYPLKNLTTSLLSAVKLFFKDVKVRPKLIRTDFDNKLMYGEVGKFIEETMTVDLESAPPHRQHQNGLVERTWQTIVCMSRNWLTAALLPSKYWWFAVKRSVELLNILPTSHVPSRVTTPHEIVFGSKVDYRQLFPMFSVAYIKQDREQGGQHKNKWRSRSLKCIVVGSDHKSDGLQFYHPPSKQLLSGNNGYRIDTFMPAGPQFSLPFDGSFVFTTRGAMDSIHKPLAHEDGKKIFYHASDNAYHPATVISIPVDDEKEPYAVQDDVSGNIHEIMASALFDSDPTAQPQDPEPSDTPTVFPLLPWIKPNAKVSLYLPDIMPKPKQGLLQYDETTNNWSFSPGKKNSHEHIQLPHFTELAQSMVTNKKLFQGWKTIKSILAARQLRATSNLIARHVSASTLHVLESPTLLRHDKLDPNDRELWDAAYREEYNGLKNFPTWEVISEKEYKRIQHVVGKPLPTMAISTIKRDEHGKPKRCKYRIVVLGNLDHHEWTKTDCFAPVLSMPELRLLTNISVQMKCIPKSGDVSQAFCQGVLPDNENYVLRPPPGCPMTPKNSYWRLIRTLYGLKRSPRHWYEKAVKILESCGLRKIHNSNCIFKGTVIKGYPPLYVGLYVDDFIFFSSSTEVENAFREKFGSQVKTTFEDEVTHFLGINFTNARHKDGNVSVHMSQEAFIDTLLVQAKLDGDDCATAPTPYRSGYAIDKIPKQNYDRATQERINHSMQRYTGSLQWLATATRPDIATATNLLSQYNHCATTGHLESCKRVIRYLKGTKSLGITFHSRSNSKLQAFVKFPISGGQLTPFTDANWGPQDQSTPKNTRPEHLDIFKTRSLSGFVIWMNGPVHWMSKRQTITARSTAEAEIYATDECTKYILHLSNILDELGLAEELMPKPTTVYNDNAACVAWSHSLTTKGLRHVQIRENAIRESVQNGRIKVKHIGGDINLSDLFTKEDKDVAHFKLIVSFLLEEQPKRT